MKAIKRPNGLVSLLLVLIFFVSTYAVYAGTTQEEIEQTQEEQEQNYSLLISAQDRIASLEAKKGDSEAYLEELNTQLTDLTKNMEYLNSSYEEKKQELASVENELLQAKESAEVQYQNMKLRIQYMYESATTTSALEALFSASSFTEFLNMAENYNQLTQYDRNMLDEYENTILSIESKEQQILSEKEEIEALKSQQSEQRSQIEAIYDAAYVEMQNCIAQLSEAESEQQELAAQIQEKESELDQLIALQYQEEAAAAMAQNQAEEQAFAATAESSEADGQSSYDYGNESETDYYSSENSGEYDYQGESAQEDSAQEETVSEDYSDNQETESSSESMTYLGNFMLTAYCPCAKCCGSWASGYTASGTWATEGRTVAMGGVPFGTKLYINGVIYTVEDRGTPYGHVDIFFDSHQAALNFGLKYADVYIVN